MSMIDDQSVDKQCVNRSSQSRYQSSGIPATIS